MDAKQIHGKITPDLEIIAHSRFNRKAALPVNRAPQKLGNIILRLQSRQLAANSTVSIPALLDAGKVAAQLWLCHAPRQFGST